MPYPSSRWTSYLGFTLVPSTALAILVACTSGPGPTAVTPTPTTTTTSEFEFVRAAVDTYLSDDKRAKTPNISAEDLYLKLNDGDATNDPFILDVRAAADFTKGHIAGAKNVPWRDVFKPEGLAKLPKDKQIVVHCYTGHTGSQATALLNAAGFNAINLKHGMSAWTTNTEYAPTRWSAEKNQKQYGLQTAAVALEKAFSAPNLDVSQQTEADKIVLDAAAAYLADDKRSKAPNMTAENLYLTLNDGNAANDPFILSVRAAADYAKGHIPGAANIPWRDVGKADNVGRLPTDRQILVYCYTGHTGSQATALLNVMGLNAINLQYGLCGWATGSAVTGCIDPTKDFKDYPVTTGT